MRNTPDGSLLCRSAPLWCSGVKLYKASEICDLAGQLPGGVDVNSDGLVRVVRPIEEVTSRETLASAEGSPITDAHPPSFITPASWRTWASGHCQNVRVGSRTPQGDVTVVGDLVIRDTPLIEKIITGTREISAGYDCCYEPAADGKSYTQRQIRINHISVLKKGRAGESVAIMDHEVNMQKEFTPEEMNAALSELNRITRMLSRGRATQTQDRDFELEAMFEESTDPEAVQFADACNALGRKLRAGSDCRPGLRERAEDGARSSDPSEDFAAQARRLHRR